MQKSEVLSHLANVLHGVATPEQTQRAIERAERLSGLAWSSTIDEQQLRFLLGLLAEEGGRIRELAEEMAGWQRDPAAPHAS